MAAKICLVTGASAGIGRATALELLRAGHTVYGVARRVDRMEDIREAGGHTLAMDVTKEEDLRRVVDTVLAEQQRIDVLVNNAGVGVYGAAEDVPLDTARHQFEVNMFGPARLIQLVLPGMRERRSGTIVNVSSIAGVISLPLGAWYHASKHALEGYSDTLRQEVGRFGIKVVVVQPGLIKTEFESSTPHDLREISGKGAYASVANAMADRAEAAFAGKNKASDPSVVAQTIRTAIDATAPKPRYAVGYMGKLLLRIHRVLSDRAFDKLVTRT
ncbi:oxidoreductase [Nonomuraea sp. CA-143628]|uniref:oxidoreductase n=1 Tax=Nonomuraea sp. CA-143628 TaxID=3239997 RepID=UPI003D8D8A68